MVKPIEYGLHELRALLGYVVRGFQEDMLLISWRSSYHREHWILRKIYGEDVVITSIDHEQRHFHAWSEVCLVAARWWRIEEIAAIEKHGRLEAVLK